MDDAFDDVCGDDHGDDACPICLAELSSEFIAIVEGAGSAEPVVRMTAVEALEWLGVDAFV